MTCWSDGPDGEANNPNVAMSALSALENRTCGLSEDGKTIYCWGFNQPHGANTQVQYEVPNGTTLVDIATGVENACGLATTGSLTCFGDGTDGQLDAPAGTYIAGSARGYHTCAINSAQNIVCWGYPEDGGEDSPAGTFTKVSAGTVHTCAIATNHEVQCFGSNFDGQVGPPPHQ